MDITPGNNKGTYFYAGRNDLSALHELACRIIQYPENKNDVFVFKCDEVFKEVLNCYHAGFRKEGAHRYNYKMKNNMV